ncbi:MAG: hypothetical protein ACI3XM_05785, partial [Eubacteriales bacterium]
MTNMTDKITDVILQRNSRVQMIVPDQCDVWIQMMIPCFRCLFGCILSFCAPAVIPCISSG